MKAPPTLPPELLQRLADIAPPPPLHWQALDAFALLALALGLPLAFVLYRRLRARPAGPRRQALRRLRRLEADWRGGRCDDRQAAYRLATLLRLGLGLSSLDEAPLPAREWRPFLDLLEALRYRPTPTRRLEEAHFRQARRWLTTTRR